VNNTIKNLNKTDMTREQMLLLKLAEECNEVAHRCSKAIRFGVDEKQTPDHENNRQRLKEELIDLSVIIDMVDRNLDLDLFRSLNTALVESRRAKVEKYMQYSKDLGILKD
jgi:NTP pyrophosphatase (non-canonical NTP hydrolase)